jgi:hypothetical protein
VRKRCNARSLFPYRGLTGLRFYSTRYMEFDATHQEVRSINSCLKSFYRVLKNREKGSAVTLSTGMSKENGMKKRSPVEEGVVRAQIEILESVYGIQILNIHELISWILAEAHSDHEVYGITAALNTWLALESPSGTIRIPEKIFRNIAEMIHKKEEFLH